MYTYMVYIITKYIWTWYACCLVVTGWRQRRQDLCLVLGLWVIHVCTCVRMYVRRSMPGSCTMYVFAYICVCDKIYAWFMDCESYMYVHVCVCMWQGVCWVLGLWVIHVCTCVSICGKVYAWFLECESYMYVNVCICMWQDLCVVLGQWVIDVYVCVCVCMWQDLCLVLVLCMYLHMCVCVTRSVLGSWAVSHTCMYMCVYVCDKIYAWVL